MAEWLRSGLQNRIHRFNSGRGLKNQKQKSLNLFKNIKSQDPDSLAFNKFNEKIREE